MFVFVFLTFALGIGVIVLQEDIWENEEEAYEAYKKAYEEGYKKGYTKGISVNFIKYDEDHKED